MVSCRLIISLAVVTFLSSQGVALADPPARVGRLSYIEGTASFHTPDQDQWSAAQLNYPVTTGSSFWTEPKAKTEIQIGGAELRMDQSTEMDITQLDDAGTVLTVPQGVINVHLNSLPPGGIEVDTPSGEVSLTKPGSYHIDAGQVDPNHPDAPPAVTQVLVLEGEAQVNADNTNSLVLPGEDAVMANNPPSFSLEEGRASPFDNWALSREKREVTHQATRYVSPEVTGYEDLDSQGTWDNHPDYGTVWYPTAVATDWAPYRYGHWAFVSPWGWTWIDDAPWGFAPFHYGRWVLVHDRWGWCPGERVARPVYAPALVAFVGGHNFEVSISIGHSAPAIGWVPLAPREVFHPYYPTSVEYVKNVNVTNVNKTVINNITVNNIHNNVTINNYANAESTSMVSANTFSKGESVHKAIVSVPREQLAKANAMPDISHIVPTREGKLGGDVAVADRANKPSPMPMQHHFNMPQSHRNQAQEVAPAIENKPAISRPNIELPNTVKPPTPVIPEVKRLIVETPREAHVEKPTAPAIPPRPIKGTELEHNNIIKPETVKPDNHMRQENTNHDTATPAPGPVVHHDVQDSKIRRPEVAKPELVTPSQPNAHEARHPEQHGQITPTHEGWKRVPPQNPHAQHPDPEAKGKGKDDKKD